MKTFSSGLKSDHCLTHHFFTDRDEDSKSQYSMPEGMSEAESGGSDTASESSSEENETCTDTSEFQERRYGGRVQ